MNCYDYRHRAVALWFLSSISLDGSGNISRTNRHSRGQVGHGFVAAAEDDDDDDKNGIEFTLRQRASVASCRSDFHAGLTNLPIRKNVCFDEVFGVVSQHYDESQSIASNPQNQSQSVLMTSGQQHARHQHLTHSANEYFRSPPFPTKIVLHEGNVCNCPPSRRLAISTVKQGPPIVVASVIPLSRDPLMHSGITKGQNGAQLGGTMSGRNATRHRSVPEAPAVLINTFFRHNTSTNVTFNSPVNGCPRSGSLGDNLPAVKPLSPTKPVGPVERSYAHFLVPRKSLQQNLTAPANRRGGRRRRTETVVGDEIPAYSVSSPANTGKSSGSGGQYRSRSHTLSLSSMTSAISKPDKSSSPIQDAANIWGLRSVESIAYPSSSENMEQSQAVIYEDPLISYDPLLLDDPMVPRVTNRRVFPFQGYMTSILGYRRADEHKKSINREFHQRFPNVQLTLTKMRSIKLNLLAIALSMNLDLWIVAHAYVLFEKMILKLFVCKANRKLCAGAALLISAKLNDLKGPVMPVFIQEIESEFRISHRDLIHMEMAAFIGLKFCVLPSPAEALPHFTQIQKSLGIVVAAPRCLSIPTRSHSPEDDNFHSYLAE